MAPVTHRLRLAPPAGAVLAAALSAPFLLAGCALAPYAGPDPAERVALDRLRAGDARGALEGYRDLARSAPPDRAARLHAEASVAAVQAGLPGDALVERLEALRLAPADAWQRFQAARLRLAGGDPSAALSGLAEPATAREWFVRGLAERRLGMTADAIGSFERARQLDPSLGVADQERGEALESLDRLPESASAYAAAISSDPSNTHLQVRLAGIETRIGRIDSAYDRYRRMLLVDAGHPVAKAAKAKLAAAQPRLARAETEREAERRREWDAFTPPRYAPLPPAPLSPVAVGIVTDIDKFRLKCGAACAVSTPGRPCEELPADAEIEGMVDGATLHLSWSGGGLASSRPIRLESADPGATFSIYRIHFEKGFYWSDQRTRSYRGDLVVRARRDAIGIVNEVPLEDYLLSVVPSEMPDNWPAEALKAQAVAARTETLKKLQRHAADGYDVCASQHCAVYSGTSNEEDSTTAAVLATRGEVLLDAEGGYLDTVYAANCGGWSSTPGAVWGTGDSSFAAVCDLPQESARAWVTVPWDPDLRERFLVERPVAYCNHSVYRASFRWTRVYTEDELAASVLRRFKLEGLKDVRIGTATPEGWATSIDLVGAAATRTVKRDAIRAALGTIRSNMVTVEHIPPGGGAPGLYIFTGAGWGHGAGMCQDGAWGMSKRGIGYRAILDHYYP